VESTVSLEVLAVNDAPVANPDGTRLTIENTAVTLDVLSNDLDIDGDSLTVISAQAEFGQVEINDDGRLTYTPNDGYIGQDTINYSISDGNGGEASSTAEISVRERSDAPMLGDDTTVSVDENTSPVGTFTAVDGNDDDISYTLHGDDADLFVVDENGNISFETPPDYEENPGPFELILRATDDT